MWEDCLPAKFSIRSETYAQHTHSTRFEIIFFAQCDFLGSPQERAVQEIFCVYAFSVLRQKCSARILEMIWKWSFWATLFSRMIERIFCVRRVLSYIGFQGAQTNFSERRNHWKFTFTGKIIFHDYLKHIFCEKNVCVYRLTSCSDKFYRIQNNSKSMFLENDVCLSRFSGCETNCQNAHSKWCEIDLFRKCDCKAHVCLHDILMCSNKFLSMYIRNDWKLIFSDNANFQDHLILCVRWMSSCAGLLGVRTNG